MSVAWHLKTWWDWCFSENGKKKQIQYLLIKMESVKMKSRKMLLVHFRSIKLGFIRTFCDFYYQDIMKT